MSQNTKTKRRADRKPPEKIRLKPEDAPQWAEWKQKWGMEYTEMASRMTAAVRAGKFSLVDA